MLFSFKKTFDIKDLYRKRMLVNLTQNKTLSIFWAVSPVAWSQGFATVFLGSGCTESLAGRLPCVCSCLSWPYAGILDLCLAPLLNVLLWNLLTLNACSPRTISMCLRTQAQTYSLGRRYLSPCSDLKPYKIISMTPSLMLPPKQKTRYPDSNPLCPSYHPGLSWGTGRAKGKESSHTDVQYVKLLLTCFVYQVNRVGLVIVLAS